ncbi:MAG TPA: caspase family protein, partial [Reyranella sp.]|nr:caspase family protein [Reyranella sp.]
QVFDTKDVGTGKLLVPSGIANDGNGGSNYAVTAINSPATGAITRLGSVSWTGAAGDGLWSSAGNWAGGAIPDRANVANVSLNGATATFTSAVPPNGTTVQIDSLSGGALNMSSGSLTVAQDANLTGYTQSGGIFDVLGNLSIISATAIQQSGGFLNVGGILSGSSGGGLSLGMNNTFGSLGSFSASGVYTLKDTGALNVTGVVSSNGNPMSITADSIAGAGGKLVAGDLSLATANGISALETQASSITVTNTSSDVDLRNVGVLNVKALSNINGSIFLDNVGNVIVSRPASGAHRAGGQMKIAAHSSITLEGDVVAGSAEFSASEGIIQTGGSLNVSGTTNLSAGTTVALTGAGNDFGTVNATAPGGISLTDANTLTPGTINAGGGAIVLDANSIGAGGPITGGAITLDSNTNVSGLNIGGAQSILLTGAANTFALTGASPTLGFTIDSPTMSILLNGATTTAALTGAAATQAVSTQSSVQAAITTAVNTATQAATSATTSGTSNTSSTGIPSPTAGLSTSFSLATAPTVVNIVTTPTTTTISSPAPSTSGTSTTTSTSLGSSPASTSSTSTTTTSSATTSSTATSTDSGASASTSSSASGSASSTASSASDTGGGTSGGTTQTASSSQQGQSQGQDGQSQGQGQDQGQGQGQSGQGQARGQGQGQGQGQSQRQGQRQQGQGQGQEQQSEQQGEGQGQGQGQGGQRQQQASTKPAAQGAQGSVAATAATAQLIQSMNQMREQKTIAVEKAIRVLEQNPSIADLKPCVGGSGGDCIAVRAPGAQVSREGLPRPKLAHVPTIERKVALLIGVSDYEGTIPKLASPVKDVQEIGGIMKEQLGYEVRTVPNADKATIVRELNRLILE